MVGAESQLLNKPDARTFIRSGVAERISAKARTYGADMLVLDADLSPSQTRNLEDATGLPICADSRAARWLASAGTSSRRSRNGGTRIGKTRTLEEFAELVEREGIIPAPYMARNHWVLLESPDVLPRAELRRLVRNSYQMVAAKLPKKVRVELGLAVSGR